MVLIFYLRYVDRQYTNNYLLYETDFVDPDSPEDKMAVKKAIKMVPIAQDIYDMDDSQIEDVEFKLSDIEQITLGESFKIAMSMHVRQYITHIITLLIINL